VNEDDRIEFGTQTHWVGFTDDTCKHELREPSLINPEWMINTWESFQQPYIVVNFEEDLLIFMLIGGNALVEKSMAQKGFEDFIKADPAAYFGALGFKSLSSIPKKSLHRAPTPKLRMKIIKRDNYRCAVCGRRPSDYTDIELHVHHIKPWARGGLTDEKNLITLSQICHKGLEPHEDHNLFSFIENSGLNVDIESKNKKFYEGVALYRRKIIDLSEVTKGA